MRVALFATAAVTALAAPLISAGAQRTVNVPTRTITRAEVEFPEPFSSLAGIREMKDGRVIVTDRIEKIIGVLDLSRGTMTTLGREGNGPGEFTLPGAVIPIPGDSTLVSDMVGKYLKISPTGQLAGDYTPAPVASTTGGGMVRVGTSSGSADAMGRLYSMGNPFRIDNGEVQQFDSSAIQRLDRRTNKTDTVGYVPAPKVEMQQVPSSGNGRGFSFSMGGRLMPFTTRLAWAVAPDGRVAVVTPEPYQVTWFSATGQKSVGQPIAYEQVRVTESEKEAYREQRRSSPPTGIAMSIGRGGGAPTVSQSSIPFEEPAEWPQFKHPFSSAQNGVVVAPSGELWILKQLPASQKNPTYDVIGARGELTGRVVLPPMSSLLGFGADGAVYLIRRDADDLQYLGRYRLTTRR